MVWSRLAWLVIRVWSVNYLFLQHINTKMAELEMEVWNFSDWEPEWNVVFLCSDFAKREDKIILNLLSFILFLYKDYNWINKDLIRFNKIIKKRRNMKKTLFEKERDISMVIDTPKSKIWNSKSTERNKQQLTCKETSR